MKTVRIGNGAGFWGDNLDAPRLLAEGGQLDYLTLEYLAELTLSILAHQKSRDPRAGSVTDFPTVLESLLSARGPGFSGGASPRAPAKGRPLNGPTPPTSPDLDDQPTKHQSNRPPDHLKIVTNAGGLNPAGCARQVAEILSAAGLNGTRIGIVTGDDLLPKLDALLDAGEPFAPLDSGAPFEEIRDRLVSANAYLGAAGIVEALAQGAQIVITGRVADASLTVGPALYEFGWLWDDWDRLAAVTVAGHLIECGAQVTGGMDSDWTEQIPLADVGYPIAELSEDGSLVITKPEGTGGSVNVGSVSEQLVYEIGDPAHYLTPDADADFSQVRLSQEGDNRVRVSGARGGPAPNRLKVSMAYRDGYTASGTLVVAGPEAARNAHACAEIVWNRVRRAGCELARTHVECLGTGDSLPGVWPRATPPEVVLRISAAAPSRDTIERFCREFAPLVTSGPPGVTGYTGPRPKPRPVLAYWPTTISRTSVNAAVTVRSVQEWLA